MMSAEQEQLLNSAMDLAATSNDQQLATLLPADLLSTTTLTYPDVSIPPSSHIISSGFPNEADCPSATTMHVTMPDLPSSVYLPPPIDILDASAPSRVSGPGFIPDFPPQRDLFSMLPLQDDASHVSPSSIGSGSVSSQGPLPSQVISQVPSPSIHGLASAYAVTGTSSLASALDTTNISVGRSRAGSTAVSPSTLPHTFPQSSIPNLEFPLPGNDSLPVRKKEDSPELSTYSHLETMFKAIAQKASIAGDACRMHQGAAASSRTQELKSAISIIDQLLSMTLSESPPSITSDLHLQAIPPAIALPSDLNTTSFPPTDSSAMDVIDAEDLSGGLHASDSSRKRCASAMDNDRIKFLKREPDEDAIALNPAAEFLSPATAAVFPSSDVSISVADNLPLTISQSAPPSRPPTPGIYPHPTSTFGHTSHQTTPLIPPAVYPHFIPPAAPLSVDYNPPTPTVPTFSPSLASSWSDTAVPSSRHHHTLSTGMRTSSLVDLQTLIPVSGTLPYSGSALYTTPPISHHPQRPSTSTSSPITPLGRVSSSGSISGSYTSSFAYPTSIYMESGKSSLPETPRKTFLHDGKVFGHVKSGVTVSPPSSTHTSNDSPPYDGDGEDDDDDRDDDTEESPVRSIRQLPSVDNLGPSNGHSDVPQEYRTEVDRIFFEYLNKICSNLEATDSKGEPIHQTLMAKKMQKLNESTDFRPFQFRIQAFTHAFLEELARQGYPEEKIPMKKIRQYLWHQPYILRFTQDGKKAKSKGNHIWNIEAKKKGDGQWEFRPFFRKLAGSPPGVAYSGLRWSWSPRIWDPQASWKDTPVDYSSPSLPSWLSWKDDTLSGIPPPDAESCDIITEAKFVLEGQEGQLSAKFHLCVAPVSALDSSFPSHSRRPSIGDARRTASDSGLAQNTNNHRSISRAPTTLLPQNPTSSQTAQVMQVFNTAIQRVAHERQSQVISHPQQQGDLEDLYKQQHVLTKTADAFNKDAHGQVVGEGNEGRVLAAAGHQVVMQAANTVRADRSAAVAGTPISQSQASAMQVVTVNEVSIAMKDAVAKAVEINGTASTSVDIIMTAASILQEQARAPSGASNIAEPSPPPETKRSHPTGTLAYPLATGMHNALRPLPPLAEYGQLS